MTPSMQTHKREIATALDLANLAAVTVKSQVLEVDFVEGFLAGPFERFRPRVVAEPVADEVCVALFGRISCVSKLVEFGRGEGKGVRRKGWGLDLQRRLRLGVARGWKAPSGGKVSSSHLERGNSG